MIPNNFNIKELLKHHGTPRLYLSDRLSLLDSFNLKNAELIIIWWAYSWRFLSWRAPALMQQSQLTRSSEAQCSRLLKWKSLTYLSVRQAWPSRKRRIDKVGFNGFQFRFKSIKSDCLGNLLIPPPPTTLSLLSCFSAPSSPLSPLPLPLLHPQWLISTLSQF